MTLAIKAVTDFIAGLTVRGAEIRDIDNIPEALSARMPVIFPRPDGFVSNFAMVRDSYGGGGTAQMTVTYQLTYRLCYAPISVDRGLFAIYEGMVDVCLLYTSDAADE